MRAEGGPLSQDATIAQVGRPLAEPVAFSGMAGLFTPAATGGRDLAVLFVSPWGLEDLSVRKFWRVTSERLCERGIASLRFDLPGTGDSLDPADPSGGLAAWERAVLQAADHLARRSGASRIALVGQGLGAALALKAAARVEGLGGVALLAPVVSGRFHLREIAAMARMVDDSLGLGEDQRPAGVSIAGFTMPDAVAADLRRLDLMALGEAPVAPVLVVGRKARPADGELAAYLKALGTRVGTLDFDGYEALTANPSVSKIPEGVAEGIADWAAGLAGPSLRPLPAPLPGGALEGGAFRETPVRFGRESPLYGMLCEPMGERRGATVLFLGVAYDRHAGWGRSVAAMARALAERGIASLRFDAANVADSPPAPGRVAQVLYDAAQEKDVAAALDFLAARGLGPVVLDGRCSGAYLAFRSAVADRRVAGAVVVNPYTFQWKAECDVDAALQTVPRALGDYGQRALQWATLRRLARGEIDVRSAAVNLFRVLGARFLAPLMLRLRPFTAEGRAVHSAFAALRERGTKLTLVYSEHDVGWAHFSAHFGPRGERLYAYGNVQLSVIADADHNLTPEHARRIHRDEVAALALQFSPDA